MNDLFEEKEKVMTQAMFIIPCQAFKKIFLLFVRFVFFPFVIATTY